MIVGRDLKRNGFMVSVEQDKKRIPLDALAGFIHVFDHVSSPENTQAANEPRIPALIIHFLLGGIEPGDILDLGAANFPTLKELSAAEDRLFATESSQEAGQIAQLLLFRSQLPVDPGDLTVLAIGIIVSLLRLADLVPGQQHRHPLRKQQGRQEISLLSLAQFLDSRVVGGSFGAAVPTQVIIGPVAVFFAVGLVVLPVVAHQIIEREAIVTGDKVDTGIRPSAALLI